MALYLIPVSVQQNNKPHEQIIGLKPGHPNQLPGLKGRAINQVKIEKAQRADTIVKSTNKDREPRRGDIL